MNLHAQKIEISRDKLKKVEESLSHLTDQTLITSSQIIEEESVRPRLRIMVEVHSEENLHRSAIYPEIFEESF